MLNKHKVLKELQEVVPQVFFKAHQELDIIRYCWDWLIENPEVKFLYNIADSYSIPIWHEPIDTVYNIEPNKDDYQVIAVDGSQIYPDKHQGLTCFLLNIGIVHLMYSECSQVFFDSAPFVFTGSQIDQAHDFTTEMINLRRSELELSMGLAESKKARLKNAGLPFIFLCDGPLTFWYLDSKDLENKHKYLTRYIALLEEFYQNRLLIAGFISLPKTKEIINIMKTGLAKSIITLENAARSEINHLVDVDVMNLFLKPFQRSTLFEHSSSIVQYYPEHLRPYFTYFNNGEEIIRIEFPAWIAQDALLVDSALSIILDQCNKGQGYPVALSEAHEQAVVKAADREFFYHMLYKMSLEHNQKYVMSSKSIKKRLIGV